MMGMNDFCRGGACLRAKGSMPAAGGARGSGARLELEQNAPHALRSKACGERRVNKQARICITDSNSELLVLYAS